MWWWWWWCGQGGGEDDEVAVETGGREGLIENVSRHRFKGEGKPESANACHTHCSTNPF